MPSTNKKLQWGKLKMNIDVKMILTDLAVPHSFLDYDYQHSAGQIGILAANAINESSELVAKTLVIEINKKKPYCIVLPVAETINFDALIKLFEGKRASLMNAEKLRKLTGFVPGGTSPIGIDQLMPVVIDSKLKDKENIFVNGGAQGKIVKISPSILQEITRATFAKVTK